MNNVHVDIFVVDILLKIMCESFKLTVEVALC